MNEKFEVENFIDSKLCESPNIYILENITFAKGF